MTNLQLITALGAYAAVIIGAVGAALYRVTRTRNGSACRQGDRVESRLHDVETDYHELKGMIVAELQAGNRRMEGMERGLETLAAVVGEIHRDVKTGRVE